MIVLVLVGGYVLGVAGFLSMIRRVTLPSWYQRWAIRTELSELARLRRTTRETAADLADRYRVAHPVEVDDIGRLLVQHSLLLDDIDRLIDHNLDALTSAD